LKKENWRNKNRAPQGEVKGDTTEKKHEGWGQGRARNEVSYSCLKERGGSTTGDGGRSSNRRNRGKEVEIGGKKK